jgi:hypothetical protein
MACEEGSEESETFVDAEATVSARYQDDITTPMFRRNGLWV